ncbi:hypothetical protein Tco_1240876 [Tanacetum coccineum]
MRRELRSVLMESRYSCDDRYASLFQQSGSVETQGQSSSASHKQTVTAQHLNIDWDTEQQGFLMRTPCTTVVRPLAECNKSDALM